MKNCNTEKAFSTKQKIINGKPLTAFREADTYITDRDKTEDSLICAVNCSPSNWVRMSQICRKSFAKEDKKQLRHIVLSLSPCDNDIPKPRFMEYIRRVCDFFEGKYYIKFAIHHNTEHVHAHILVCNTSFKDGKQLSFGEPECSKFRQYCNTVAAEFGLKGIEKLDETDEDPFEINEAWYYEKINFPFDAKQSLYTPTVKDQTYDIDPEQLWRPIAPVIFNLFLPMNAKFSAFPNSNGQYILSSKPVPYTAEGYYTPSEQPCYIDVQPDNVQGSYVTEPQDSVIHDAEGGIAQNISFFSENEVVIDPETGKAKIYKK